MCANIKRLDFDWSQKKMRGMSVVETRGQLRTSLVAVYAERLSTHARTLSVSRYKQRIMARHESSLSEGQDWSSRNKVAQRAKHSLFIVREQRGLTLHCCINFFCYC